MVPAHEPADHARPTTCAVLTRIRILNVDRMGNAFEPDPQGNTLPTVFPLYTAPARARVVLNLSLPKWPTSRTAQGPAAHLGLNRHDSSQLWLLGMPLRSEAPWTILTPTVHRPSRRAAETGGREVATTRTEERAERLPPRTAATRNWYAVAGARPVPRYDVTVPGTEPIILPSFRIRYLSGGGPLAGPAQRNATELVVEEPATSPAGCSSGGLCHGAQITRPAISPMTTVAIATRGTAHFRRRRGAPTGAAGAAESVTGAGATESVAGASAAESVTRAGAAGSETGAGTAESLTAG